MPWLAACSWLEFTKCRLEVVYWRLKSFRYEKMTDFMIFYKNKGGRLQSHSDWRPMTPSWGQPRLHTELSYCCLLANEVRWSICHFAFRLFIGRTDAEAETPILWPLDVKTWLFGKHPDAGKDLRRQPSGWRHNTKGHCHRRASSGNTRRFHTQLTRGLRRTEHLERQSEFPSSDKTRPDSPVPTLQGPCGNKSKNKQMGPN